MNVTIHLLLFGWLLTACAPGFQQSTTPATPASVASCPVTLPPADPFTPSEPYPPTPPGDHFWYGDESLWTALPPDGVWDYLPRNSGGYTQKLLWWRVGYSWTEEPVPDLQVSAHRLDDSSISFSESPATNAFAPKFGSAMLIGVDFPTPGCWQITGRYADAELTYVVQIEPGHTARTTPTPPGYDATVTPPAGLPTAAMETVIAFNQTDGVRETGPFIDIPPELWHPAIAALQPRRVYWHQNNLAVVLAETDATETGLYIGVPISSYVVQNDDTIQLIPEAAGLFRFSKKRSD
jgi:hypothetical protein